MAVTPDDIRCVLRHLGRAHEELERLHAIEDPSPTKALLAEYADDVDATIRAMTRAFEIPEGEG